MNGQYRIGDIVLKNWTITRSIGEGSYGRVFEIYREEYGHKYYAALKIVTIPRSQSEVKSVMADGLDERSVTAYYKSLVEEFVEEFTLMSMLKGNSNIVSYEDHEVIKHEGSIGWDICIRMEILTPLLDYLQVRALSKKDVIKIGMDLCKALQLCHMHDIVHRDIKPENIYVSETGDFKLGDFGIARTVDRASSGLTKRGTYTYMAPEMYRGEAYTSSVDIYSLGIVMYRLLNWHRAPFLPDYPAPITHNDREKALAKRMAGTPLPMPKSMGGSLAEIVLKACAFDPAVRYSSPTQMREDIESVLKNCEEAQIAPGEGAFGQRKLPQDGDDEALSPLIDKSYESDEQTTYIWRERVHSEAEVPRDEHIASKEEAAQVTIQSPIPLPQPMEKKKKPSHIALFSLSAAVVIILAVFLILFVSRNDNVGDTSGFESDYELASSPTLPVNTETITPTPSDDMIGEGDEHDEEGRITKQMISGINGQIIGWIEFWYHGNGNLAEEAEFDASGNALRRVYYLEDESMSSWWSNTYNEIGNRVLSVKYNENEKKELSREYTYNVAGANTRIVDCWYDDSEILTHFAVFDLFNNGETRQASFYTYEEDGERLHETREYRTNGTLRMNTFFEYDASGSLSKRFENEFDDAGAQLLYIHEYNNRNVRVLLTEFDYNENGEETQHRESVLNPNGTVTRIGYYLPGETSPYRTVYSQSSTPPPMPEPEPEPDPEPEPEPEPPPPPVPEGCPNPSHGEYDEYQQPRITFDESGRVFREYYYYRDGCVWYCIEYVYDREGNIWNIIRYD